MKRDGRRGIRDEDVSVSGMQNYFLERSSYWILL